MRKGLPCALRAAIHTLDGMEVAERAAAQQEFLVVVSLDTGRSVEVSLVLCLLSSNSQFQLPLKLTNLPSARTEAVCSPVAADNSWIMV